MNTPPPAGWYHPTQAAPAPSWPGPYPLPGQAVAVAVPMVVEDRRSFAQRHPVWTTIGVLWVMNMLVQFHWLGPTLIAGGLIALGYMWLKRRTREETALAAEADRQNRLALQGDPRGTYGDFPPPDL